MKQSIRRALPYGVVTVLLGGIWMMVALLQGDREQVENGAVVMFIVAPVFVFVVAGYENNRRLYKENRARAREAMERKKKK